MTWPAVLLRRRFGRWGLVLLTLVAAAVSYGAIAYATRNAPGIDLPGYKYWTRLVTVDGMHAAYSGEYPQTYAVYGPVALAGFRVVGAIYQGLVDPAFQPGPALESPTLTVLIRSEILVFHLLVGLAVFLLARCIAAFWPAYVAMLAYLAHPGMMFDVAYWGQPDPVFGVFIMLALGAAAAPPVRCLSAALQGGWLAAIGLTLAALAKPQAWVFFPLVGSLIARRGGVPALAKGATAGVATGLLVVLPFILHGTLAELAGLPLAISRVLPVVSANAHNLWWLLLGSAASWTPDQETFIGPVSYRLVGMLLVALFAALAVARALPTPDAGVVCEAGAYTSYTFFMVMTQIHENHMYMVFPLLAVAAVARRRLWFVYAGLALTWCANMLLHTRGASALASSVPELLELAPRLDALLNTVILAIWTAWVVAETFRARRFSAASPFRPC